MVKGEVLFGIDAADCMFHPPLYPGYWWDYLERYREREPESLPVILEMMQRIAARPELPDLVAQELAEAPGPVFGIPYRDVAMFSADLRRMQEDLFDALEREMSQGGASHRP